MRQLEFPAGGLMSYGQEEIMIILSIELNALRAKQL
jgi:hypothetical protein